MENDLNRVTDTPGPTSPVRYTITSDQINNNDSIPLRHYLNAAIEIYNIKPNPDGYDLDKDVVTRILKIAKLLRDGD